MTLGTLLGERRVLVTLGPGGVGKTTTAAALGLKAAQAGRSTLVCTIDPAKRLASSLGVEGLGDQPERVDLGRLGAAAPAAPLFAMMLDAEAALDRLLLESSPRAGAGEALRTHPLYRVMARELPGMHEYAAVSRLYELWHEGRFDLVVLDTPPTTHALDFLDAPLRLERALDSPAVQWLVRPYLRAGRLSLKMLGGARAYVLRRLAQIVGTGLLERMAEFLVLFEGVLDGVRARTSAVSALLTSSEVGYVLVSSPTPANAEETVLLAEQLARRRLPIAALIMNRMHLTASTEALSSEAFAEALAEVPAVRALPGDAQLRLLDEITRSHQAFAQLARADRRRLDTVLARLDGAPALATVPLLAEDIFDLEGLLAVGRFLE